LPHQAIGVILLSENGIEKMYKRFIYKVLIIASILLPVNAALAQEPLLLKEAAQANLWKGFGKGYKMLGDTTRVHIYNRVETAGWIASGIGVVGLAGTKVAYDLLVATIGRVSTALQLATLIYSPKSLVDNTIIVFLKGLFIESIHGISYSNNRSPVC